MPLDNKKGFTLIELLVVIAIISILSVIGLTQLASAREKARDSQRRLDLSQYQHVLTLYFDDQANTYPLVIGDKTGVTVVADHSRTDSTNPTGIFASGGVILPTYIKQEVKDPFLGRDGHEYFYTANCNTGDCVGATGARDYLIYTKLETGNYIYALGPAGLISDTTNKKTNPPTCPGAGSGNAMLACLPPS